MPRDMKPPLTRLPRAEYLSPDQPCANARCVAAIRAHLAGCGRPPLRWTNAAADWDRCAAFDRTRVAARHDVPAPAVHRTIHPAGPGHGGCGMKRGDAPPCHGTAEACPATSAACSSAARGSVLAWMDTCSTECAATPMPAVSPQPSPATTFRCGIAMTVAWSRSAGMVVIRMLGAMPFHMKIGLAVRAGFATVSFRNGHPNIGRLA